MLRASTAAVTIALAVPFAAVAARPRPIEPRLAAAAARPLPAGARPLEVTRAFYRALHAGDADAAAKLAAGDAAPAVRAFVRLARAHRDLEAAVAKQFGKQEAARVGYGNKVQAEVKALLGAEERIDGDEAQVSTLDGRVLATLVRAGPSWKVQLEDPLVTPEGAARLQRVAAANEAEARRVVAGIRKGKYPDAGAAVRDFERAVSKATGGEDEPPAQDEEEGTPL